MTQNFNGGWHWDHPLRWRCLYLYADLLKCVQQATFDEINQFVNVAAFGDQRRGNGEPIGVDTHNQAIVERGAFEGST